MPFAELLQKVEGAITRLPQLADQVLESLEAEIIDLNVEQLKHGRTSEGEPITPEYASDDYAGYKKSTGSLAPFGTPDLILEGDFTGDFYMEKRGDSSLLDSKDPKTPDLDMKYENIFGLTNDSREELSELAIEELTILVENEIFR